MNTFANMVESRQRLSNNEPAKAPWGRAHYRKSGQFPHFWVFGHEPSECPLRL